MFKKYIITGILLLIVVFFISDKTNTVNKNSIAGKAYESGPSLQRNQTDPLPIGSRLLGIGLTEGSGDFKLALEVGKNLGQNLVEFPIFWDEVEFESGKYKSGWMKLANSFYPGENVQVALTINPIDTNTIRVPNNLKNVAFNDPELISRFKSFVDYIASELQELRVPYIAIGNEVDIFLANSPKAQEEYDQFLAAVIPYVKKKFPGAMVGTKITYRGVMNRAEYVTKLVAVSDALFVTYYPFIPGTFMVADPGVIHADIDNIFSLYPNKNLYLAEVGYPSGVENGSSQKKQADFVRELFSVLDRYPKRIPGMNYLWLNDLSSQAVSDYAVYYGTPNKYFVSFLSSLGLKTYNGEAKLGFNAFQEEIDKRR